MALSLLIPNCRERVKKDGAKFMYSNFKWPISLMVILSLLYRLAFNDSIASNYETPPGYSAPKSITQIENEERLAFEKALAEATPEVKPKTALTVENQTPVKTKHLAKHKKHFLKNRGYLVLIDYKAKRNPARKLN